MMELFTQATAVIGVTIVFAIYGIGMYQLGVSNGLKKFRKKLEASSFMQSEAYYKLLAQVKECQEKQQLHI